MIRRSDPRSRRRGRFAAAILVLAASPAIAQLTPLPDPIAFVTASFETWAPTALGPLPDHGALTAGSGPAYSLPGLGPLPDDAEVDALADVGGGVWWFSLADWALLPGGVRAHPGDVVLWNGAVYAKIFDLLGCGFPPGLNVDAIDVYAGLFGGYILVLSFDTNLFLFSGGGPWVLFDEEMTSVNPEICSVGSAAFGIPVPERRLDIDAVSSAGRWGLLLDRQFYVSFDTWAALGSLRVGPDDFPFYRIISAQWEAPITLPNFGPLPERELDALAIVHAGIFADDFETGSTSRWSSTSP